MSVDPNSPLYFGLAAGLAGVAGFGAYFFAVPYQHWRKNKRDEMSTMPKKRLHQLMALMFASAAFFFVVYNTALLIGQGFTVGSTVGEISFGSVREWGRWVAYSLAFSAIWYGVGAYLCINDLWIMLTSFGVMLAGTAATFATLTEIVERYYTWLIFAIVITVPIVIVHFAFLKRKDGYAYGALAWILVEAAAYILFWILGQPGERLWTDIGIDRWIFSSLDTALLLLGVYLVWTHDNDHYGTTKKYMRSSYAAGETL